MIEIPYSIAERGTETLEKYIRNLIPEYVLPNVEIDYSEEKSSLISRINQLRSKNSFTCIGIDKIVGGKTYVTMKCKMSHEWVVLAHSITHMKRGCPACIGRKRTIDDIKLIAIDRGGKCLSKTYINVITKMLWECSMEHRWMDTLNKILCGRWCPECAKKSRVENKRLNKGWSYEMICKLYKNNIPIKDICSRFNICSATVKKAIKGL